MMFGRGRPKASLEEEILYPFPNVKELKEVLSVNIAIRNALMMALGIAVPIYFSYRDATLSIAVGGYVFFVTLQQLLGSRREFIIGRMLSLLVTSNPATWINKVPAELRPYAQQLIRIIQQPLTKETILRAIQDGVITADELIDIIAAVGLAEAAIQKLSKKKNQESQPVEVAASPAS